jgi:predicted transcriptional regulator
MKVIETGRESHTISDGGSMRLTARQAAVLTAVYSVRGPIRSKAIASKLNLDSRDGSAKITPALKHLLKAGLIQAEKKNKRATGYRRAKCRIPPYQIVRRGRESDDIVVVQSDALISCPTTNGVAYCVMCRQLEMMCPHAGPSDHS